MRMEHFHFLLEVYRHHSISAAAHALKVRQSTLSSAIKSAEQELGFPIFLRAPAGVTTTAEGERFIKLAWEINVRYEALKCLKGQNEEDAMPLQVLMSPCVNAGLALPLSRRFYEFELRGDLVLEEVRGTEIAAAIGRDEASLGVAHMTAPMLEAFQRQHERTVQVEVLYRDYACLLVPADHRLAGWASIQVEDLSGERVATISDYWNMQNNSFLDSVERVAAQVISFPNLPAMKQAVRELGMVGVSTLYVTQAGDLDHEAYRMVPFAEQNDAAMLSVCLFYRNDRSPRYQERILISCIRDYFQSLPSTNRCPNYK